MLPPEPESEPREASEANALQLINEELDVLIVHNLELVQDYCTSSLEMENVMSRGYIQISKSKMVMRPNSISSMFLPSQCTDQKALITVAGGSAESSERKLQYSAPVGEQNEALRKVRQKVGGFLSSHSLGAAQDMFLSALERTAERATIQGEIAECTQKFQNLSKRKDELLRKNIEQ